MKHNRKTVSQAAAALVVSVSLLPGFAAAQTTASDGWRFGAVLYGYFPSIGGTANFPALNKTADISVSSSDVISSLKFAFMGTLLAQKGPWGGFTDVVYSDLSGSKSGTRDLNIHGVTIPVGITADANLDVKTTLWTLAGSYRFVDTPAQFFDGFVGARLIDLKQSLDYQFSADVPPFAGPSRQGSLSTSLNNWDVILGVKGRLFFGDQRDWFAQYYFDAGTGQSQYTYQAIGGLGYRFSWGEAIAAWRYIKYDFFSNQAATLSLNGPAVGVEFHW
jgi:hypothetical protein